MFPFIAIELSLWLIYFMYKGAAFEYMNTESKMFHYEDEEEKTYTEDELADEEDWVTFNNAFDF